VDIGTSSVKVVQLVPTYQGLFLKAMAIESIPSYIVTNEGLTNTSMLTDILRRLFKAYQIKNKNIALAVSTPDTCVKLIQLPKVPAQEIEELISWEAPQYLPWPPEELYVDYQLLSTSSESPFAEAILVAVKRERIDPLLEVCREAGLRPVVVDAGVMALENQYEVNYHNDYKRTVLMADIGASTVNLVVLKDGSTIYATSFAGGGNDFTKALQRDFDISFEEAEFAKKGKLMPDISMSEVKQRIFEVADELARRIQQRLDYFQAIYPNETISKVLLCGGVALFKGLDRFLARKFNLPVEVANPLQELIVDKRRYGGVRFSQIAPLLAVSVGLALRRIGDSSH